MSVQKTVAKAEKTVLPGTVAAPETGVMPETTITSETTVLPERAVTGPPVLRFDASVPRYLVHRASSAEVFVTDSAATGEHAYQVAAQLPRGHYMGENTGLYDFLILVEVVRQAGVLVAHRYLDVSLDTSFVFRALRVTVGDLRNMFVGSSPGKAVVVMTVAPERADDGRVSGLAFGGGMEIDGRPTLDGNGKVLFVTRSSYRALRSRGRESRIARERPAVLSFVPARPDAVGRRHAGNIVITEPAVLGERQVGASLVVDVNHPCPFEHPLDHVPGNLSLEACRQIAIAAVGREYGLVPAGLTVVGMSVEFEEFAELDLITRVSAEVGDLTVDERIDAAAAPVEVTLTQAGALIAAAKVRVGVRR